MSLLWVSARGVPVALVPRAPRSAANGPGLSFGQPVGLVVRQVLDRALGVGVVVGGPR